MDSLCNHKDFTTRWADGETPQCTCSILQSHLSSTQVPSHFHLDGDLLQLESAPLSSIATGWLPSEQDFSTQKEIWKSLQEAFVQWHRRNAIPSLPLRHLEDLWHRSWTQHVLQLQHHITHKDISQFVKLFPGAVFHNEDKRATSLRIYCPCLYFECLEATFADPQVFKRLDESPESLIHSMIDRLTRGFRKSYPWSLGKGKSFPNAYVFQTGKRTFAQVGLLSAFSLLLSDLC